MIPASKFASLVFREFRLTKKNTMLYGILLILWVALTWGVVLSLDANGIDRNELPVDNLIIETALLGAVVLFLDNLHHADIVSGWITYSYALPITPFERAAVRFARRFLICVGSCLICLINSVAACAYLGKPFGVNYILWHILAFAAVILCSLPDAFFGLRARNDEEAKKMRSVSGMASLAVMIAVVLVIVLVSGVDLQELINGETSIKLPVFTAGALVWALPLLLGLMAADFCLTYHSLRAAYQGAPKTKSARREKDQTDISSKPDDVVQDEAGGATGFLYKELAQNRMMLILTAFVPLLLTALPFCFTVAGVLTGSQSMESMFETAANEVVRMIMAVVGMFVVSGMMSEVFRGDNRKSWAYFVASTPQGVKGYLYNKYVVMLLMNLIYMVAGIFADNLFSTVYYFVMGKEIVTNMSYLYLAGVFLVMFISTFDIPFTVRYGLKKGSLLKVTVMLALCVAAVFGFVMMPDAMQDKVIAFAISILDGKADGVLLLVLSICPYLCFGAFLYSYRISCKAFMKGVDEYDG
ncbi:MAG: ABC-2 transporter permease [Blautia sp.]|nr:ABC-2 transporter permease [Lachnoclostridium sp.]MCM1212657.1 ABC-2 transporter permease [Blautia sp.]